MRSLIEWILIVLLVAFVAFKWGQWYQTNQENMAYWQQVSDTYGADIAHQIYQSNR